MKRPKEHHPCTQPPFPLHQNEATPSFREGFDNIVRLLQGKKNIVALVGAGISVSCGIPDFRSAKTGLYSTVDAIDLGLSCPEELFDWHFFQDHPEPFYKFARKLYFPLGNEKRVQPSDSHKLLALLEQKKMLLRVYSQNIDGLEEMAGVSRKRVVYAHGSLREAMCLRCKRKVAFLPGSRFEQDVLQGNVARCTAQRNNKKHDQLQSTRKRQREDVCGGVLKPGVTFFGESLHDNVRKSLESDRLKADAIIVIGTSLSVAPISKVIRYLPVSVPRLLVNRTLVHPKHDQSDEQDPEDFRRNYVFDAYLLGYCDEITRALGKKVLAVKCNSSKTPPSPSSVQQHDEPVVERGELLSTLTEADASSDFLFSDWESVKVPRDRVFLFPGAQGISAAHDTVDYDEIAHCDGCQDRISGTIQKCQECFDYDLCTECFPVMSKNHFNGKHTFVSEVTTYLFPR